MAIHISLTKLAVGFIKTAAKAELDRIRDVLINVGRASAVSMTCSAIKARTGLPQGVCQKAGDMVVSKLSKAIRDKIKK